MRVDGVVYQVPERSKSAGQVIKSPQREAMETGAGQEERAQKQTEELVASQSLLEKQREEARESKDSLERDPTTEKEESRLEKFMEAARDMNEAANRQHISLRFRMHEDSERWMVQIVDIMEDEVIRVIPPEELLNLSAQLQKLTGVLLDTRR
jgi:flagellar protein FlaG